MLFNYLKLSVRLMARSVFFISPPIWIQNGISHFVLQIA